MRLLKIGGGLLIATVVVLWAISVSQAKLLVANQTYHIPLPKPAFRVGRDRYMCFLSNPIDYYRFRLPKAGWKLEDQAGSLYVVSNGSIRVEILEKHQFTKFISRLEFYPVSLTEEA